jgi:hypothetical protein
MGICFQIKLIRADRQDCIPRKKEKNGQKKEKNYWQIFLEKSSCYPNKPEM